MSVIPENVQEHWVAVCPLLYINNEEEYDKAIERLNKLLDEVGNDEHHPLYELLDTLGAVIHACEEIHHPIPESSGSEMLKFFMEEHGLAESDLPELGSGSVVSEFLAGKRELGASAIRFLAQRFHVSPAVFV